MKVKTNKLIGAALDWAVAKCESRTLKRNPMGPQSGHGWWVWEETPSGRGGIDLSASVYMEVGPRIRPKTRTSGEKYSPSTDWSQGGPIIDLMTRDGLRLKALKCGYSTDPTHVIADINGATSVSGPTPPSSQPCAATSPRRWATK